MDRRDPVEIIMSLFLAVTLAIGLGVMITRTIDTVVEVQQQQSEFKG